MKVISHRIPIIVLLAATSGIALAGEAMAKLTGAQETPAVISDAQGMSGIVIAADHTVSGAVKTTGIVGTAAHIHMAATGASGPAILTLAATGADEWRVPEGSKLTDDQYAAYKAGMLYVNVHSTAYKDGEIRTQLTP